jgi:nucleoside-diphosphate kinase
MQQTLVIMKPDAVRRGIVGEILTRFERVGLKIIGMKMVYPDAEHFHKHYEGIGSLISRRGEDVFKINLEAMKESPVIAIVLEGIDAVEYVRKMVGATDPKQALPGTIRADFTHISLEYTKREGRTLPNIIHASADEAEAQQEIALWFQPFELHSYDTAHGKIVHGRKPA